MNSSLNKRFLNLYFQVHQPRRLRSFRFFDVGLNIPYFDDNLNKTILQRIAKNCYLPTNKLLLDLIRRFPTFKITFSISGTALEQFEKYSPEVMRSFRMLADTGQVEFLGETYHHSLSYFINEQEFIDQVTMHRKKLYQTLGTIPAVFRNTELIYSDGIGRTISGLGFKGMYVDGIEKILKGKSPNAIYRHPTEPLLLLPRNYRLSDDIAFRYGDSNWSESPLTATKYCQWLSSIPSDEQFICLGMDYETFGEHKKKTSGIFSFLGELITELISERQVEFINPSDVPDLLKVQDIISTERAVSWADEARDLSAWLGNDMQRDAFDSLYHFHDSIVSCGDSKLLSRYRYLQTSDHFYYMSTKKGDDGNVHQYFSPFNSPYEAFMNFMNVITDLEYELKMLKNRSTFCQKTRAADSEQLLAKEEKN